MAVKIFDSLSGEKKPLPRTKELRLFVCGPTVYDCAHLGHARTYIFFDFLAKYLRKELGLKVFYLQNITDIDDKIIARAKKEGKKPADIAKFYTKAYFEDMKKLGIDAVTKYAPATKFIPQIINQVQRLIKKGYGYEIPNDGYYFDISKFKDYGKLSRRSAEQAESATSRIDESVGKRNKGDFCMWKFSTGADLRGLDADLRGKKFTVIDGEPAWWSTLGWGRPGWHIEDTAITEYFFGPQYDIHGGGVDLKFPHHEAEIAQQEALSGKRYDRDESFVKIWMHTGFLLARGKKMSKSLGNFITIRDFLKKHSADVLRFMVLSSSHYRSPMDYSDVLAIQAEKNLNNIFRLIAKINFRLKNTKGGITNTISVKGYTGQDYSGLFKSGLADDLNTPAAISILFRAVEQGNKMFRLSSREALIKTRNFIIGSLKTLGFAPKMPVIPAKIRKLVAEREKFRGSKQFSHSDRLRKKIEGLGYEVEDTPRGPFLWPKFSLKLWQKNRD
jgi:cysteinyl-tRNA synthetase